MTRMPDAAQRPDLVSHSWISGVSSVLRPQLWSQKPESGPQEFRNVIGRTKGAAGREEWRLVERARAGDSDALSVLFARNRMSLYRKAYSLLRNKEDAEDALQDGLLSAYLHLGSFEGRARFSTWLTRIVMNSALMNRRRIHAHSPLSLEECAASESVHGASVAVDGDPDPEQLLAQSQTWAAVEKGINRLSPLLRSALLLRDMQDLSTREAAIAANVKVNVIKSRLQCARRRLATFVTARRKNLYPGRV